METVRKHQQNWIIAGLFCVVFLLAGSPKAFAHCDSFAGPVIKEAQKALETNKVELLYKWITPDDEKQINDLFAKTYSLRNGDKEVYRIVEQHFLETLVRLHRASENASYTGLKSSDSVESIIKMSDDAILTGDIDGLLSKLNAHMNKVLKAKYDKMKALEVKKDASPEQGRAYVRAYVDYIYSIAGIHAIIEGKVSDNSNPSGVASDHEC